MAEQPNRYLIPAGRHRVEEEIQRSRFITSIAHCASREEAERFVAELRAEFPDATHNCWAYIAGPPGSQLHIGMSDDGEPKGTAGRPMLTVLTHCKVGEIAAVVTRYFGGTKLGTGGLTRAYGGGVKLALDSLPTTEKIDWQPLTLTIDYPILDQLRLLLAPHEAEVLQEQFTDRVRIELRLPREQIDAFRHAVTELSSGRALIDLG
ncbi:YigZ family protein [bacterium]|nr:YigZ family protein [bacterium]